MTMFYVYHLAHPGNPWGPFATRTAAREFVADLQRTFCGPYEIKRQ